MIGNTLAEERLVDVRHVALEGLAAGPAPVPVAAHHPAAHYPDVYFRPEYGLSDSSVSGAEWVGIERFDGLFQMPLLLRPVTAELLDATSPYGYSGVYASPTLSPDDVQRAWRSVRRELRERNVVSVFLRQSPLVPQAAIPFPHVPVVTGHPTVGMDVRDPAAAWDEMAGRSRNKVRRARKLGYRVEIAPAQLGDLMVGGDFRRLYEETMRRRQAGDAYFFPDQYYTRLLTGLGPQLLLARGLDAEDSVQSVALFMHHGDYTHYHLSGSSAAAGSSGLNNLLIWTMAEHSADLGASVLHLGGGMKAGDALEGFKSSFGPHRYSYSATGVVINPTAYETLVREQRGDAADVGYFPAYRAGAEG
jgi:serine/alanine adding enzyme